MNFLFERLKIKSVPCCTMHEIRSYASLLSWLLTKDNPHLYYHVFLVILCAFYDSLGMF